MTERTGASRRWLPGGVADRGAASSVGDGRIAERRAPARARPGADAAARPALPGLANAHSHAFHRALRGRTQRGRGTFWTWRELMYRVAARLTPTRYRALARAVYAEMALAGITASASSTTCTTPPAARRYADPNAMGRR